MGRDAYGVRAKVYDRVVEPMNAPLRRIARRMCPPDPGWTVLDIGCGTGAALAEYADEGCAVVGVDTSPAMITAARERLGSEADLRLVEGSRLPVADGSADLVLVSLVLHSISRSDGVALLREARRTLAPGGRVLVTDFGTDGLRFPRGWGTRAFTAVAELLAGPRHARNALTYLRRGGLRSLVDEAGLTLTTQRPSAGGNITLAVLTV
ncbi:MULTISPECIES: class I SAM-dependent methyltransferase [unclassified Isoptericola]|uniref:class I SAM-dependent methyltransferase n=1 Tax=unclassified Isoptericola TaxID=2623355 RepID=UPI002712C4B0|nr:MULTISPECIES: class I SAM-dependent methyltransferase [unclassified Isoptericola]MDO8145624.1 methyltransferase domain-containing protein [Isoptericola sp. 178]MDO8149180.1 methyltransferase domain-containing protein [Isoptericola sp. b515]